LACEHCLAANDNPTAAINDQNQALAADLNPPLHLTIVEMAELDGCKFALLPLSLPQMV
jgi:hypothetical protein